MKHIFTLALPAVYQRRGAKYPGIAFFGGEGEGAQGLDEVNPQSPFGIDLAAAEDHPMLARMQDINEGEVGLIWLTAEELSGEPRLPKPDMREPGENVDDSEGLNAWDAPYMMLGAEGLQTASIWLQKNNDPNAGYPPLNEWNSSSLPTDFASTRSADGETAPWVHELMGGQLGGTSFCYQAAPEGMSPWYFEIGEIRGLNFGGGIAQVCLEHHLYDWA